MRAKYFAWILFLQQLNWCIVEFAHVFVGLILTNCWSTVLLKLPIVKKWMTWVASSDKNKPDAFWEKGIFFICKYCLGWARTCIIRPGIKPSQRHHTAIMLFLALFCILWPTFIYRIFSHEVADAVFPLTLYSLHFVQVCNFQWDNPAVTWQCCQVLHPAAG